ncbi:transcription elongation factor GreA [Patescibacteria group bacterium]
MKKYLTTEGLKKLKDELEYLEKVKRKEVTEWIRHTASQGDLKENAGYDAAKDEQGFVEGRIFELKGILAQSEVIKKDTTDKIQLGSVVSLTSKEGNLAFQIVEPEEADVLNKKISFKSPLGEILFGKKKGNSLKLDTPEGKKEYKIIKIE